MKIQYQNKVAIDLQPGVPRKNKVTDEDMNEIKQVVNANADTLDSTVTTVTGFVNNTDNRLGTVESTVVNLDDRLDTAEDNISNLQSAVGTIEDITYTKTETDDLLSGLNTTLGGRITDEVTAREGADTNLQRQIDSIVASSDVVDIVGTYQELLNYDTSKLGDNDIIKVLDDSTHNNATSYFRWKKSSSTWQYIGSEGPYYTKSETDSLLNGKVNVVSGKGLSTNDFTTALLNKLNGIETGAQVNKIESIKVNNVTQTITSKAVNITVPTKTSDINNDSGFITENDLTDYVKNTDYATVDTAGVIKANSYYALSMYQGNLYAQTKTNEQYSTAENGIFISKGTLDNVLNARIGDIDTALDLINGEVIS